jgi:hypothetical protein
VVNPTATPAPGRALPADAPEYIQKQDLWGIHDMLLVAWGCTACGTNVNLQNKVQKAVVDFANLLKVLHPLEECRTKLQSIQDCKVGEKTCIDSVANANLECLGATPACNPSDWFCTTGQPFSKYKAATVDQEGTNAPNFQAGSFPKAYPWIQSGGVCDIGQKTKWGYACSVWVAIHALGLRADAKNLQLPLLTSLAPMIAGNLLNCAS